jgi:hypothetical protein
MVVPYSGRFMVRVPRAQFQAITASAAFRQQPRTSSTRPLFGATHAASMVFSTHLAPAQQTDWLLHQSVLSDLHPWDTAHQIAQGKLPGSEQFGASADAYVEPDLLNTRQYPSPSAAATRAVPPAAAKPAEGTSPVQPVEGLNQAYDPSPAPDGTITFSPGWYTDVQHSNFVEAWNVTKGKGIRIAHPDTGYTPGHMSVPRNLLPQEGWNFYENNNNAIDPYLSTPWDMPGHGTATLALLAGGSVDIEYGAGPVYDGDVGGAPDAFVIPIRIGPSVIHLYSADLAQGLDYALAPTSGGICDIVSLSHGGLPSNAWAEAVNRLYEAGVVLVAAAGDSFYLEVMDVATHFTVYPSAFYRVITATGATYSEGPYVTTKLGTMQGCWGPDKVMKKAVAGYTPNVPWMCSKTNPQAWDMNGGGTSAATPQIAAACALWLAEHGSQFPRGWQRVEACRRALFESVKNRGDDLQCIGVGILDANEMLSSATLAAVQAAYANNELPCVDPDQVSFPFWRLLFGIAPPGNGVDEMYETEAAQTFYRSANKELAAAVESNPDGDPAKMPSADDAKRLRDAFIAEPSISNTLKARLQSALSSPPK